MAEGALGSDHVNYLVLRYLQEAGHESAARALYQDWHRPSEYRDPETLPFAAVVKQNELVNIIQDGLFHDQLQASVTNQNRRFQLIEKNQSRPTSSHHNASEARAQAAARRMSNFAQANERDDFPTPAAKRPRRSNGSEVYINGDVMEVDKRAPDDAQSPSADAERAQSDIEPIAEEETPVELASSGTQTDKKAKTITSTMYWTLDKREPASILHTTWSPQSATTNRLLTVGESLCRLYEVPDSLQDGDNVGHIDPLAVPRDSIVSAACWHPNGRYATCAMEVARQDDREASHRMFDVNVEGVKRHYDLPSYMLRPPGMALAIRYSVNGDYMLIASTNGRRGLIEIWSAGSDFKLLDPIATKLFEHVVLDAVWTSDSSIVVCGDNLIDFCTIENSAQVNGERNGHSLMTTGARNVRTDHSHPTTKQWDKIRFDSKHSVVAVNSSQEPYLMLLHKQDGSWTTGPQLPKNDSGKRGLTALAFRPLTESTGNDSESPRRLATAYESGDVFIYDVNSQSCEKVVELSMGPREQALALAWSAEGSMLAVASDESINVWTIDDGNTTPLISWQAAPARWYQGNDNNLPGDEEGPVEPSLSWNAEGKRLAFAVGRKIAIVSLVTGPQDTEMADADADAEEA